MQTNPTLESLAVGDAVAIANVNRGFYSDSSRPKVTHSIFNVGRVTKDFLVLTNGKRINKRSRRIVGQSYGPEAIPATPELIAKNLVEVAVEREFSRVMLLCISLSKRIDRMHKMSVEQLQEAAALETRFQEAEAAAAAATTAEN